MLRYMWIIVIATISFHTSLRADDLKVNLQPVTIVDLGVKPGQMRAVPVEMGNGNEALLLVYSESAEVDPYRKMFFFPQDGLRMLLCDRDGKVIWRKELNRGVIPGIWFCPVFPFDLDGDGVDEIWYVENSDPDHPLNIDDYKLAKLNAATSELEGTWDWPTPDLNQTSSHVYRNFILGGHVDGEPVLVTAQGTYGPMKLQGWNPDMSIRWEHEIAGNSLGARGSHMCPVIDLDGDGTDELFWGERLIELDKGTKVFCADENEWDSHSDVIQPVLDRETGKWYIYTCREGKMENPPRIVTFDSEGKKVWSDIEQGHMDMGWVAGIGEGGRKVAMTIRVGGKTAGSKGFFRTGVEEFAWDLLSGEPIDLPYSVYQSLPVDIDGDGIHELVRPGEPGSEIIDKEGNVLSSLGGGVVIVGKLFNLPAEQVVCSYGDGTVKVWADLDAEDSNEAKSRYGHHFYKANRKLTATGYNKVNLGGI